VAGSFVLDPLKFTPFNINLALKSPTQPYFYSAASYKLAPYFYYDHFMLNSCVMVLIVFLPFKQIVNK